MTSTTLCLPVLDPPGGATESLPVADLGGGRFRLLHSPGFVQGLAAGDVFERTGDAAGFRVLKRSGFVCVWIMGEGSIPAPAAREVAVRVAAAGGAMDGGFRDVLLIANFALMGSDFSPIERCMKRLEAELGLCWEYGNVYDVATRKPLDWWA